MNTNNAYLRLSEIASRIKEMREILGITKEEMAQKTEVSLEQYLEYEGGKTDIPFSFIHKCAQVFGIGMSDLLEGTTSARLTSYTVTRRGAGQETAKEDACKLEHDISDETFEAIKRVYQQMKK